MKFALPGGGTVRLEVVNEDQADFAIETLDGQLIPVSEPTPSVEEE